MTTTDNHIRSRTYSWSARMELHDLPARAGTRVGTVVAVAAAEVTAPATPTRPRLAFRPLSSGDLGAVRAFVAALSPESRRLRFFAAGAVPEWMIRRLVETPTSYVATRGNRVVGLAGSHRLLTDPRTADLAVVVADEEQSSGVGRHLLAMCAAGARADGATSAELTVLAENRRAVRLVRRLWPDARVAIDGYVYEFTVRLS